MKAYLWFSLSLLVVVAAAVSRQGLLNQTTVALLLVVLVTAIAAVWGRWPALVSALLAGLAFGRGHSAHIR
jgi:hypothetical protein